MIRKSFQHDAFRANPSDDQSMIGIYSIADEGKNLLIKQQERQTSLIYLASNQLTIVLSYRMGKRNVYELDMKASLLAHRLPCG